METYVKKKRVKSPPRDTSPVPSHYSEPVVLRPYKGTTQAVGHLRGAAGDDDDVLSLKSVQSVRSTVGFAPVKRYRGFSRRLAPKYRLPPVCVEGDPRRSGLMVRGASCPRYGTLPPIDTPTGAQSQGQEPTPSRGDCRPDVGGFCQLQRERTEKAEEQISDVPGSRNDRAGALDLTPSTRITFQSPAVQGLFPVTSDSSAADWKVDKVKIPPHTKSVSSSTTTSSFSSYISRASNKSGRSSTGRSCVKQSGENNPAHPDHMAKPRDDRGNGPEKSEILMIELGITFPKIESNLRSRNQKHPLKSALKKSFDWKAYSQKIRLSETRGKDGGGAEMLSPDNFHSLHTAPPCPCSKAVCTGCFGPQRLASLLEESCDPSPNNSLLEPFSGFREYLQRQLMRSPGPYRAGQTPAVRPGGPGTGVASMLNYPSPTEKALLLLLPPPLPGSHGPLPQRTVELSSSHGGVLPKITMTCPTPSPKPPMPR